jgi:hypothetical protein
MLFAEVMTDFDQAPLEQAVNPWFETVLVGPHRIYSKMQHPSGKRRHDHSYSVGGFHLVEPHSWPFSKGARGPGPSAPKNLISLSM